MLAGNCKFLVGKCPKQAIKWQKLKCLRLGHFSVNVYIGVPYLLAVWVVTPVGKDSMTTLKTKHLYSNILHSNLLHCLCTAYYCNLLPSPGLGQWELK